MQSISHSHAFTLTGLSPASDTATESSSALRSPDSRNGASRAFAPGFSERACQKCRAAKRRCDKALPHCTRCTRLSATCIYLADPVTGPSTAPSQAPLVSLPSQSLSKSEFLCAPDPLAELTAPLILSLVSADAAPGEQSDWTDGVRAYYACVHKWYSVVHRGLFDSRIDYLIASADSPAAALSSSSSCFAGGSSSITLRKCSTDWNIVAANMSRELALLILAMYLSARTCSTNSGCSRDMFDNLYRVVRRAFTLGLCEATAPGIEFIQIGALLSLYEYGHGRSAMAYRTLSETAAAANVLGIRPGSMSDPVPLNTNGLNAMEQEQRSALWWSVFILDQLIHRDDASTHLPFILMTPEPDTLLPESGQISAGRLQSGSSHGSPGMSNRWLPIGAGVNVASMESFQISAKVASLLHRALRHSNETRMRSPGTLPPVETFASLDEEIRNMTLTLLKDATDWRYALDCFAMCCSALFTLYLPFLPVLESKTAAQINDDTELRTALAALRFAAQMSSDITCKMNIEADNSNQELSCRELAALAAPTCYVVVQVYTSLRNIFPHEYQKCQDAIMDKYKSLKFFRCRWGIADKMMNKLDEVYGIDWYRRPEINSAVQLQDTKNHCLATTKPISLSAPQAIGAILNSDDRGSMDLS